jgi:hypothetical protein
MGYSHLIKRSFDIVARKPYLWLLGLLAGGATAIDSWNGGPTYGRPTTSSTYTIPSWAAVQNVWSANWELIVGVLAFLVILAIVIFVLGSIATGGIVRAGVEHDEGHEYGLRTAWRAGYATGWRIAGLRLLTALLTLVPGILTGTLFFAFAVRAMDSDVAAIGFGLLAAVAFLVSMVFWLALGVAFQLAQRLVVLEGGHVAESLSKGFGMIRWHFKEVVLGWLILIALSIGVGIAFAFLAAVVAIPALAVGFGGWAIGGLTGAIVAGSFAMVFFLGVLIAAAAAYSAYSSVYWTLLFRSVRALPAPATRGAMIQAA